MCVFGGKRDGTPSMIPFKSASGYIETTMLIGRGELECYE